jgi:hypothetical protein
MQLCGRIPPLSARKQFVKWVGRNHSPGQASFAIELLLDFVQNAPSSFTGSCGCTICVREPMKFLNASAGTTLDPPVACYSKTFGSSCGSAAWHLRAM